MFCKKDFLPYLCIFLTSESTKYNKINIVKMIEIAIYTQLNML